MPDETTTLVPPPGTRGHLRTPDGQYYELDQDGFLHAPALHLQVLAAMGCRLPRPDERPAAPAPTGGIPTAVTPLPTQAEVIHDAEAQDAAEATPDPTPATPEPAPDSAPAIAPAPVADPATAPTPPAS